MPRVHTRTKSTRGRKTFPCRGCSEPITVGQTFYTWKKRYGGTSYMHTSHGYPKPSMLSNRKTAVIEDAIQDFPGSVESVEEISDALSAIAETAREVGQEYSDSADNMPESLQQGYQAEAMREVGQELESWADELESFEPDVEDEPDEPGIFTDPEPDRKDFDTEAEYDEALDDWEQEKQQSEDEHSEYDDAVQAREDALIGARDEAESMLGDMPEYQG